MARASFGARVPAVLGVALLLSVPARWARAEPQATAGLTVGVAGRAVDHGFWDQSVFHLGARGDVIFGREGNFDFGLGPYLEVATHAFDEIQVGGGVSGLLPVIEDVPLILSLGAYGRGGEGPFGFEPGVAAEVFWGVRSYNFHSTYVMSGGLLAEMRYGLGDSGETSIVIGAQLDFLAMSLPFIYLANAVSGSPEVDPVR